MNSQPAVLPADLSPSFIMAFDCIHCPIIEPDNQDDGEAFIISVDGTHCPINEPRKEPSSGWYSKKHNIADGLTYYEVGIAISGNTLVWINGPSSPPAQNDITSG